MAEPFVVYEEVTNTREVLRGDSHLSAPRLLMYVIAQLKRLGREDEAKFLPQVPTYCRTIMSHVVAKRLAEPLQLSVRQLVDDAGAYWADFDEKLAAKLKERSGEP